MSDVITTLHKKGDNTVNVYPNIKSDNIPDDSITTDKIVNNAITSDKIESGSITRSKLVANVISSNEITDGAIITNKIGDDAVTTIKIEDGAVTLSKLDAPLRTLYKHTFVITINSKDYLISLITKDDTIYIKDYVRESKVYNLINNLIFKADEIFYMEDSGISPQISFKLFNLTDDTYDEYILNVSGGNTLLWGTNTICNIDYSTMGYTINTSYDDNVCAIDNVYNE